MIYNNIAECIGNTPVVAFHDELVPAGKKLFLKLDYFNPTFSIKDRTALGLVKSAMSSGRIQKGSIVIESTSGNLGKSLAMLGAVYGFRVIIVVDPKVSFGLLRWYKAYGAEVDMVVTPASNGSFQKARLARVQELLAQYPNAYWTNQYDNPSNPSYHAETTSLEIMDLPVDSIVGAVSTGGHLCGIGKRVKETRPDMKIIACDVVGSAIFTSRFAPYLINGVGLSWRSDNMDITVLDQICISSDQEAISTCRILAQEHGLLLGGSAGLVVFTALAWLQNRSVSSTLAIIPDTGMNYLDQFYDNDWLEAKGIALLTKLELKEAIQSKAFARLPQDEALISN